MIGFAELVDSAGADSQLIEKHCPTAAEVIELAGEYSWLPSFDLAG